MREIYFGEDAARFADDAHGGHEGGIEGAPEDGSSEDEDGIGGGAAVDADDVAFVEEDPDEGVGERGERDPEEAKEALAVGGLGVADEEAPSEVAGLGELGPERQEGEAEPGQPGMGNEDANNLGHFLKGGGAGKLWGPD